MVRFTTAACLAVAMLRTASAFAPGAVPRQPTFVPTSTTALSMNLFDRFSRVAKANVDSVLKRLEDPEKIMNQALEDMQVRRLSFARTKARRQLHDSLSLF